MPADFLKKIASEKKEDLKSRVSYYKELKRNTKSRQRRGSFKSAISKPGQVNLVAEIKKASPSAGIIREDFDALRIAGIYVEHKAAALSVLTEEKYFLGKPDHLKQISGKYYVPTLMKDFIIHEYQVCEGASCGAAAILLIAAMLSDAQLKDLMAAAHGLGMDCLVEVHDEKELDRALKAGVEIVGINNRDLHSLKVSFETCLRVIPRIPKDKVVVAESGFRSHEDVRRAGEAGAHAVLIGETFMRAPDIGAKVREVMHGQS